MKLTSFINTLFFPVLLLATPNETNYLKLKTTWDNNITYLKFMLKSPMIGEERYNYQKGMEENYISHISVIDIKKDKKILDVSTSSYMRENLIIKFKYIDIERSENIKFIITDNKGSQNNYNANTNKGKSQYLTPSKATALYDKVETINYRKQNPQIFKSKNIDEAIKALYGTVKEPIENKIKLSLKEHNYCHELIPIHISSDVDLESFAIFNNQNKYPTIAVFSLDKVKMIDLKFNVRMFKACTDYSIIIVGKDSMGNIYITSEKARVACADGCGGGG